MVARAVEVMEVARAVEETAEVEMAEVRVVVVTAVVTAAVVRAVASGRSRARKRRRCTGPSSPARAASACSAGANSRPPRGR